MQEPNEKKKNLFGRLLRFWRTTFGMSQEDLSWEVGVSTRHLSFLESGRSLPSRSTILKIAQAFNLGTKDTNSLLVSAGYLPQRSGLTLESPELKWLRKALIVTMRGRDPHPTHVSEPCGNIVMVNRAWLRFYLDNAARPESLHGLQNSYHLYFGDQGLRAHLLNWDILACGLLMNLQQEVLLNDDPGGQKVLDELLTYPHIPKNWQQRAVAIAHMPYYSINLQLRDNTTRSYRSITNTVGSTPYISEPRLLLTTLFPKDGEPYSRLEDLENDTSLQHELLFY